MNCVNEQYDTTGRSGLYKVNGYTDIVCKIAVTSVREGSNRRKEGERLAFKSF